MQGKGTLSEGLGALFRVSDLWVAVFLRGGAKCVLLRFSAMAASSTVEPAVQRCMPGHDQCTVVSCAECSRVVLRMTCLQLVVLLVVGHAV